MEKIPVRAPVFSAVLTMPYLIGLVLALFARPANDEDRTSGVLIVLTLMLTLRCPLTALITYASNKK